MRTWIAGTVTSMLLVALSAGVVPWRDAIGGAFRPPDFAQDIAAARILDRGEDPYTGNFSEVHAQVLGIPSADGYPYLPHPPFAIILSWPFARLPFAVAALYWFAGSLACLFVLAVILSGFACNEGKFHLPRSSHAVLCFAALLLWPPVLYNLEKGQFSILIATLIAFAWVRLSDCDRPVGGICLGFATALKLFPALLGLLLLIRRRRSATWLVVTAVAITTGPLFWIGWRGVPEFVGQTSQNLLYWQTWPAVTYSLRGLAARLFIAGSDWSLAVAHAPTFANAAVITSSIGLVSIALVVTLRHRPRHDSNDLLFATWSVLLLPLNPLAMGHNGVLLALPIVLIGRALASDPSKLLKVLWLLGCVLVSIPRQAIFNAASIPVSPLHSVAIVALPLWGTLLLFATGVALVNREVASLTFSDADQPKSKYFERSESRDRSEIPAHTWTR